MSRRIWRNYDWALLLALLALMAIGLVAIHSATLDPTGTTERLWDDFVVRQAVYGAVGLLLMVVVSAIDYRFYRGASRFIYIIGLVLLALIFFLGQVRGGAQSWFDLGLFPVQPSELIKVVLILILAKYLSDHAESIHRLEHLIVSLVLVAVPVGMVYLQPDLGTAMVMIGIWAGMAWAAGIPIWQFALLGAVGLGAAPAVWFRLEDYMQDRVRAFLNPQGDPSGQSYNTIQALISIGSGGVWGKGLGQGTQSQLHFLRVRHTDFIFSVFAEEFGFVGCIMLFALFAFLLWRILRVASLARDGFGRLIACGVAMMILVQAVVNLGVNLSLLPATGLPLPLVSYGGSSLITTLIAIGLVQSVVMRHRKMEFE